MMMACMLALATTICGFEVKSVRPIPNRPAKLWQLEDVRTGAELLWIDCDDENRTFAVAFCTLPEDDTGVAHIIEHSVLCGSEKFPSREPFVELLKSSVRTFLNAYTAKDCTAYPVASRNERDFFNLMEVYLDAAFHPLSIKNDWSMNQEGWHYEFDGTNLTRNGVVYSEMKGSFSNPSTISYHESFRMLFPDNAYSRVSGGDPSHIPELTFENYKRFYERHYHPSNAHFYLYGKLELEKALKLIESSIASFTDRRERVRIVPQKPVVAARTVDYPSSETKDRTMLTDCWMVGSYTDYERMLAIDVLAELLTGSNFSPLKAALLDKGLCEDVYFGLVEGFQCVAMLNLRNVKDGATDESRRVVRETLARLVREGLDQKRIAQLLDRREFLVRERDSAQQGLDLFKDLRYELLFGSDPMMCLDELPVFAALRSKLGTGWYEKLLEEVFFDNPHRSELTLKPSATLADERAAAEKAELAGILAGMSADERAEIVRRTSELKKRASEPEDPAVLAKLPRLSRSDISVDIAVPQRTIGALDGTTVIRPKIELDGIFYLDLCFSLSSLSETEIKDVPLLCELLGELGTSERSAAELKGEIDAKLGVFEVAPRSYQTGPRLVVRIAALNAHRADARRLVEEILVHTDFSDVGEIAKHRTRRRAGMERSANGSAAQRFALLRAESSLDECGRVDELFNGLTQLRHLQNSDSGDFHSLALRIFTQSNLTVLLAGEFPDEELKRVIAGLPTGAKTPRTVFAPTANEDRAFEIDSPVGYAVSAMRLPEDVPYSGSQLVATRILSLEYLWPEVRMKGGAYGASLTVRPEGNVVFGSYRDPNPARSFTAYARAADALEEFVKSGRSYEMFQVSTSVTTDPNLSKREQMSMIRAYAFDARELDELRRLRREILFTTDEQLLAFAQTLRTLSAKPVRCALGGDAVLNACGFAAVEKVAGGGKVSTK